MLNCHLNYFKGDLVFRSVLIRKFYKRLQLNDSCGTMASPFSSVLLIEAKWMAFNGCISRCLYEVNSYSLELEIVSARTFINQVNLLFCSCLTLMLIIWFMGIDIFGALYGYRREEGLMDDLSHNVCRYGSKQNFNYMNWLMSSL